MIDVKYKLLGSGVVIASILTAFLVWPNSDQNQKEAASLPQSSELANRKGFAELKSHVENLAAIEEMCRDKDQSICYCELAQKITVEHEAIDRLLKADPELRSIVVAVRFPASELPVQRYDLNKLPAVPDENSCLSTVAAPTLIESESHDI